MLNRLTDIYNDFFGTVKPKSNKSVRVWSEEFIKKTTIFNSDRDIIKNHPLKPIESDNKWSYEGIRQQLTKPVKPLTWYEYLNTHKYEILGGILAVSVVCLFIYTKGDFSEAKEIVVAGTTGIGGWIGNQISKPYYWIKDYFSSDKPSNPSIGDVKSMDTSNYSTAGASSETGNVASTSRSSVDGVAPHELYYRGSSNDTMSPGPSMPGAFEFESTATWSKNIGKLLNRELTLDEIQNYRILLRSHISNKIGIDQFKAEVSKMVENLTGRLPSPEQKDWGLLADSRKSPPVQGLGLDLQSSSNSLEDSSSSLIRSDSQETIKPETPYLDDTSIISSIFNKINSLSWNFTSIPDDQLIHSKIKIERFFKIYLEYVFSKYELHNPSANFKVEFSIKNFLLNYDLKKISLELDEEDIKRLTERSNEVFFDQGHIPVKDLLEKILEVSKTLVRSK
jgi:hypothetical protein